MRSIPIHELKSTEGSNSFHTLKWWTLSMNSKLILVLYYSPNLHFEHPLNPESSLLRTHSVVSDHTFSLKLACVIWTLLRYIDPSQITLDITSPMCAHEATLWHLTSEFQFILAIRFSWLRARGVCFKYMYAVAMPNRAGTQSFWRQMTVIIPYSVDMKIVNNY